MIDVLVIGADSRLGSLICERLDAVGTSRRTPLPGRRLPLDLSTPTPLPAAKVTYLCAAVNKFKACDDDRDHARQVNVVGTMQVARQQLARGGRIVFLSSAAAERHTDRAYGQFKREVEGLLAQYGERVSIFRFGPVSFPGRFCYPDGDYMPVTPTQVVDTVTQPFRPGVHRILNTTRRTSGMGVTLLIATRGRPDECRKTIVETTRVATRADTKILLLADEDDKDTLRMLATLDGIDERVIVSVRPREDSRGEKYGRALAEAPADVYLIGHDCVTISTPGFDEKIMEAFHLLPDGIGVINSPMANASFPGLQGITAKLAAKLGYIYNPEYPFWFIDHEMDDFARMLGRGVFIDIEYEHLSRRPGKTLRLRDLEFWTRYFDCMTWERRAKMHAIIDGEDFIAPPWMKEILKRAHPPIESRSFNINHNVRQSAAAIEATRGEEGPPDEGYLRLLKAAEDKLVALGFAHRVAA